MLQAVGRADLPVKLLTVAMAIKIGVNWFLCAIPQVNIKGAGVGTLLCYLFYLVAQLICLNKVSGVRLGLWNLFAKPLVPAALCGAGAYESYCVFYKLGCGNTAAAACAVVVGGIIYVTALFLVNALRKKDLMMLPNGQKIAKTLEKRGWI